MTYTSTHKSSVRVHYKYADSKPDAVAKDLFISYTHSCLERGCEVEDYNEVMNNCECTAKWFTDTTTKPWLFLIGKVGTGKTTMLRAIRDVQRCLVISWIDGFSNLEYTKRYESVNASAFDLVEYSTSEEHKYLYGRILKGDSRCTYLYLDDVGQEPIEVKNYGNSIVPFVEIVNRRYASQLPMVVTSNLTMANFGERYGDRVLDRIKEMSEILTFTGKSYRR